MTTTQQFLDEYGTSNIEANQSPEKFKDIIFSFLNGIQLAMREPHPFEPYHKAIREPFDYYKWGNDFMKPLIILDQSILRGEQNFKKISECIGKGENVVILSNHQTEADPQVISVLLEKYGIHELAEKIVYIAGHKVTSDPIAIPFSMGRDLLCIHSKKHIKNPPELIGVKQAQNLATMKVSLV